MTYFVYKITNNSNSKIYIGKTNDPEKRWYNHVYCALVNKEKTYFYNAIRKYGAQNFLVEVIEKCPDEATVLERERYWIDLLQSNHRDIGYNMTDGGDGISGLKHSEETKKKIALAHLGKTQSEETKIKMSEAHKGQVVLQETREKISQANSGENNGMYGKTISDETRSKLSRFQSSRPRLPLVEEHKQRNRESAKKQDRTFRIPLEVKSEIVSLYGGGSYTKRQLAEKFRLKYNSIVKIIRTNKKA